SAGAMSHDEDSILAAPESAQPDREFARRESQAKVDAICNRMDLGKRAVFLMFEIEGMSCPEIAAQLDVPVGTVYSRLHAARRFFVDEVVRQSRAADGFATGTRGDDE